MSKLEQEDSLRDRMTHKRSLPAWPKRGKNGEKKAFFVVILNSICSCFDSFHGLKDNYLAFIPESFP